MPWSPAFARRAWRSKPLADIALAIVLAALSLLTLETQQQVRVDQSSDTELSIQPTPVTPGDPVEITVRKGGKPFSTPNVEPLLTIQNVTTGKWKTYVAEPTAEPGVYRIPAVYPGKGVYSYTVLYGPFEQNVTIRGPNQPATLPADPLVASSGSDSPSLWAVALTLLATLPIALRRRFPLLVFAVTLTAALVMDVRYNSFQFRRSGRRPLHGRGLRRSPRLDRHRRGHGTRPPHHAIRRRHHRSRGKRFDLRHLRGRVGRR